MICRECGARIDDDAVECKFCGASYGDAQNLPQQEQEPVSEDNTEETNGIAEEEAKDEIDELFDENEEKRRAQMEKIRVEKQSQLEEIEKRRKVRKRKQRRNVMLIVLLVLLICVAVGVGIYYVNPAYNNDGNDDVVIVTQQPTEPPKATEKPLPTETSEPTETEEAPVATETTELIATPAPTVAANVKPVKTQKPIATATQKPAQTQKTTPQASSRKTISSALITGGEVVSANGNTYMSFTYNGKWNYAKVSANTTTNFIAWKPMTFSGYTNGETYNGAPVYTVTKLTHYNGTYILQNSGTAIVNASDLEGMSKDQLRLARNEIYARHGRKFSDASLQNYFNSCSWYKVRSNYNYSNENANLNSTEKKNVAFIKSYEDSLN